MSDRCTKLNKIEQGVAHAMSHTSMGHKSNGRHGITYHIKCESYKEQQKMLYSRWSLAEVVCCMLGFGLSRASHSNGAMDNGSNYDRQ